MDRLEKKKILLREIPLSSGKRITAMLMRYWESVKEENNLVKTAKDIFLNEKLPLDK